MSIQTGFLCTGGTAQARITINCCHQALPLQDLSLPAPQWEQREHPPSSSVHSILPAPEHHGNEVIASSEGRSDAELGISAVLVAESKQGERGNASGNEQASRSPSSDSLGQPQPGSWGPASSSSPSCRDPV